MKWPLYVLAIITLALTACKNSGKKNDVKPQDELAADTATSEPVIKCESGNFVIETDEALQMKESFVNAFGSHVKKDSFFVDTCVIRSFQVLCNSDNKYDGIRIYSIKKTATDNPHILIVPTIRGNTDTSHRDVWGETVKPKCTSREFENFNVKPEDSKIWRGNFDSHRRTANQGGQKELSKAVWINKCVLDELFEYIKEPNNMIDGIRIHYGAYDTVHSETYASKQVQSSFLIVVTQKGERDGHNDNWDIIQQKMKNDRKFAADGYNHGQLCPSVCD